MKFETEIPVMLVILLSQDRWNFSNLRFPNGVSKLTLVILQHHCEVTFVVLSVICQELIDHPDIWYRYLCPSSKWTVMTLEISKLFMSHDHNVKISKNTGLWLNICKTNAMAFLLFLLWGLLAVGKRPVLPTATFRFYASGSRLCLPTLKACISQNN